MLHLRSLITLLIISLNACAYTQKQALDPNASLYERLGQRPALEAVIKDFTQRVTKDPRINGFFIGTDLEHVNRMLVEQICQASGGPCVYSGQDMIDVHTGMNITPAQFNALVEDLSKSLDHFRVASKEQQELLALLGSMKQQIINR